MHISEKFNENFWSKDSIFFLFFSKFSLYNLYIEKFRAFTGVIN